MVIFDLLSLSDCDCWPPCGHTAYSTTSTAYRLPGVTRSPEQPASTTPEAQCDTPNGVQYEGYLFFRRVGTRRARTIQYSIYAAAPSLRSDSVHEVPTDAAASLASRGQCAQGAHRHIHLVPARGHSMIGKSSRGRLGQTQSDNKTIIQAAK